MVREIYYLRQNRILPPNLNPLSLLFFCRLGSMPNRITDICDIIHDTQSTDGKPVRPMLLLLPHGNTSSCNH